jgi:hypothetical protein
MAIFFPSDAKAKDAPGGPEQKVLNALKKELDDSWKVIPNLYLAKHEKQLRGEADIVLIREGVVILLEVKGGVISRGSSRRWSQNRRDLKCPVTQASANFETIKKYTKEASGRFSMAEWCCIFPQSVFRETSIEWRDDQMFDSRTLINGIANALISLHERVVKEQLPKLGLGSKLDDKATDALVHILRPEIEGKMNVSDLVELAEIEVGQLEAEQLDALGMIMANKRVVVTGGAGSGKTVLGYLACERFLNENASARAAFVCCSSHLAQDIRRKADRSNFGSRLHVYSLHDLTRYFWERLVASPVRHKSIGVCAFAREGWLESWSLGANLSFESPSETYLKLLDMERNGLAERTAINFKTLYSKSPICSRKLFLDGNQFDFVVIDEAQDFTYSPHDLCYLSLVIKGGLSDGKVVWIQDIHQSIRPFFVEYDMTGMPSFSPEELSYAECPLPPKNYRNPPGVVALAGAFNPGVPQKSLRESPQGNECEYVLCNNGKIGDSLDEVLTRLDQEGVKSSDIAIVTIDGFGEEAFKRGSLHSGHRVIKVPADQEQAVLRDNPDVIRAMNLLEAKGREFPVVILVDLPDMDKDHEHNFMHVAITRAKAKLFVICGPERMATLRKIAAGEA